MKIVLLFGLLTTAFGIDSPGTFSYSTQQIRAAFDSLDNSGDGTIHLSDLFTKFRKTDTNDDKMVSLEEFTAGLSPDTPSSVVIGLFNSFDDMDDNADGFLGQSVICRFFTFLDANNNRKAVFLEFKLAVGQMLSSIQEV